MTYDDKMKFFATKPVLSQKLYEGELSVSSQTLCQPPLPSEKYRTYYDKIKLYATKTFKKDRQRSKVKDDIRKLAFLIYA